MEKNEKMKGTLITGVIGEDVHVVGIRILEHAMRDAGYKVVSLGVQISQEEFVNAALETNADAILVSSLSGHAKILIPGLRDKCEKAGLKNIVIYLGGSLVIGKTDWKDVQKFFVELGINRIYSPETLPSQVIKDLEADLSAKRR
jgi:methylaspartate mutase sigma subunit